MLKSYKQLEEASENDEVKIEEINPTHHLKEAIKE